MLCEPEKGAGMENEGSLRGISRSLAGLTQVTSDKGISSARIPQRTRRPSRLSE